MTLLQEIREAFTPWLTVGELDTMIFTKSQIWEQQRNNIAVFHELFGRDLSGIPREMKAEYKELQRRHKSTFAELTTLKKEKFLTVIAWNLFWRLPMYTLYVLHSRSGNLDRFSECVHFLTVFFPDFIQIMLTVKVSTVGSFLFKLATCLFFSISIFCIYFPPSRIPEIRNFVESVIISKDSAIEIFDGYYEYFTDLIRDYKNVATRVYQRMFNPFRVAFFQF